MNLSLGVLQLAIGAVLAAGCASAPSVPVPEGSRIVVRLYDGDQDIELALTNASNPEMHDLYSRRLTNANLKLARDDLVGELLASLQAEGLLLYGRPGRPSPGSQAWLTVDQDGDVRTFNRPDPSAPAEELQSFARMKLLMTYYYQHVGQKQFVENPQGADIFKEAR